MKLKLHTYGYDTVDGNLVRVRRDEIYFWSPVNMETGEVELEQFNDNLKPILEPWKWQKFKMVLAEEEPTDSISRNNLHILDDVQVRAKAGDASAQYALGIAYANREDVIQHHANQESVKWLRKAANQGHWAAQHALGMSYFSGKGVEVNKEEAQRWFALAETNRKGKRKDTIQEDAIKTPEDPLKVLREAAEQGNVVAQHNLGMCYDNGYAGVEVDRKEAQRWLELAAANRIALAETNRKGTRKD